MTPQRLQELIHIYREGRITAVELNELRAIFLQDPLPDEWSEDIREMLLQSFSTPAITSEQDGEVWQHIEANSRPTVIPLKRSLWRKISWAAAVLVVLCASGYFVWQPRHNVIQPDISQQLIKNIQPASEGAILTLDDGRQLVLDSLGNGRVATQRGSNVSLKDGALLYDAGKSDQGATAYNTLQTPRGRQFNLRLPDGTMVWLNAASSIRYPVVFAANERRVEIQGEAYFEVMSDKTKPFYVMVQKAAEIKVVGTHFNINAYGDEAEYATTLLSGIIEMQSADAGKKLVLRPGQQATIQVNKPATLQLAGEVDTVKVMAWKNGVFDFNDASLHQVMRQLARWYDITVTYENDAPEMKFGGKIGRNLNLAEVLTILEKARVKFRMDENRKLVVLSTKHAG